MRYEYVRIRGGGDVELTQTMMRLGDEGTEVVQVSGDHRPGDRYYTWEVLARRALPSNDYGDGPNTIDPADRQDVAASLSLTDLRLLDETEHKLETLCVELVDIRDNGTVNMHVRARLARVCEIMSAMESKLERRRIER